MEFDAVRRRTIWRCWSTAHRACCCWRANSSSAASSACHAIAQASVIRNPHAIISGWLQSADALFITLLTCQPHAQVSSSLAPWCGRPVLSGFKPRNLGLAPRARQIAVFALRSHLGACRLELHLLQLPQRIRRPLLRSHALPMVRPHPAKARTSAACKYRLPSRGFCDFAVSQWQCRP